MATTTNYGWDLIATNQASPEVTANSTFKAIDAQMKKPAASSPVPSAHNSTGTAGQMAVDATHIYFCYATNSWLQVSTSGTFSTSF
jgi:hypothetical protein